MEYNVRYFITREGHFQKKIIQASTEAEAVEIISQEGGIVLSISASRSSRQRLGGGRKRLNVGQFSQELLTLLDAGLSITEAVDALEEKTRRPNSRQIIGEIRKRIAEGKSLSRALSDFPEAFSSFYLALIKSSERIGAIPETLRRYVEYHQQIDQVRAKIVSASIYPILLLVVGGLVVLFLLGYVAPKFSDIYRDMDTELPFLSRILLVWGDWVQENGLYFIAGIGIFFTLIALMFSSTNFREMLVNRLSKFPALGDYYLKYNLSKIFRTLAMLLRGGMPMVQSMMLLDGVSISSVFGEKIQQSMEDVRQGRALSYAFETYGLTTDIGTRLLKVGEKSGDLAAALERAARLYDEEVVRAIDLYSRLIEPALMVVVGAIIGFIILMMYMPIFELANGIQ